MSATLGTPAALIQSSLSFTPQLASMQEVVEAKLSEREIPIVPMFIIRAGATGSGKGMTEGAVMNYLKLNPNSTMVIDVDELVSKLTTYEEDLKRKDKNPTDLYFQHRPLANIWSTYLLGGAVLNRVNIILETTGEPRGYEWLTRKSQQLRWNGYQTVLVYVFASDKKLVTNIEERNKKQPRKVDPTWALQSSQKIRANIATLASKVDRFLIVDTTSGTPKLIVDLNIAAAKCACEWPLEFPRTLKDYINMKCTSCGDLPMILKKEEENKTQK